jgi:hypothetical protein
MTKIGGNPLIAWQWHNCGVMPKTCARLNVRICLLEYEEDTIHSAM